METAKLFRNGKSQAVRLPKEYRFSGDKVIIKRVGNAVILLPYQDSWQTLFESLEQFSDDFMSDARQQPETQKRENIFEIVSYYGEFAETISSQNRENIRERLSAYLDCQFLQRKSILDFREGDRLSGKFLDTPDRPHWNIEVEMYNDSIHVMLTVGIDILPSA